MAYKFPILKNIEDILPAIAGADEFIIKRDEVSRLLIANYVVSKETTFPDPLFFTDPIEQNNAAIRRECRGLTFDMDSGELVVRKFFKFFNVGQIAETQPNKIDWSRRHFILDKADGSLITGYRRKDGFFEWHTKMGNTDVAKPVYDYVNRSSIKYEYFVDAMITNGKTACFEWCSRHNRVVVDYPNENLILISIRDNLTGDIMMYPEMKDISIKYGIPIIGALNSSVDDIEKFMKDARAIEGTEGYVIVFENEMYKVKSEWYCNIHSTKDTISMEKRVWQLILEDTLDDVKPFMDETDLKEVESFALDLMKSVSDFASRMNKQVSEYRNIYGNDTKRFAVEAMNVPGVNSIEKSIMFAIWNGRNSLETVINYMKGKTGTINTINEIRWMVGGLSWNDYHKLYGND